MSEYARALLKRRGFLTILKITLTNTKARRINKISIAWILVLGAVGDCRGTKWAKDGLAVINRVKNKITGSCTNLRSLCIQY